MEAVAGVVAGTGSGALLLAGFDAILAVHARVLWRWCALVDDLNVEYGILSIFGGLIVVTLDVDAFERRVTMNGRAFGAMGIRFLQRTLARRFTGFATTAFANTGVDRSEANET